LYFVMAAPKFTPGGVAHLQRLKHLKKMDFSAAWISSAGEHYGDEVARQLAAISQLESIRGLGYLSAEGMKALTALLESATPIRSIEGVDIANLGGSEAVGALVSFLDGRPFKPGYRRFRIKTVEGQDDFAMMREVVFRRFRRLTDELSVRPDLVLVDGGLGHLHAAAAAIAAVGAERPHLVSLAKRDEEVYVLGKAEAEPLRLPRTHPGLKVLQAVRDEAHRFAQHYHHLLRRKALFGEKEARRLAAERKAKRARTRKAEGGAGQTGGSAAGEAGP
jgi:excinuclease ABC subunit C